MDRDGEAWEENGVVGLGGKVKRGLVGGSMMLVTRCRGLRGKQTLLCRRV